MPRCEFNSGECLRPRARYDEAIAELQAGAKAAPADVSLQRDLADLYVLAKKNDQAEAAYRKLLATNPNDAALHQSLGKALLEEKKFADAEKEFLAAIKLKPELGDSVRRPGLCRQREPGLSVDHSKRSTPA